MQSGPADTVARLVERLRQTDPTHSMLADASRILGKVEPIARRSCKAAARGASEAQIDELVQETLEIAWRKMPEFRAGEASFATWVRGIARHVCANALRRRRDVFAEDGLIEPADPTLDVLAGLEREQREQLVIGAIEGVLEGIEQDVLYHRYVHGLERERIAELLGLADANAVRVVLQRAQRRLKAELERRIAALGHGPSFFRLPDR